jgi:hypothetical protein
MKYESLHMHRYNSKNANASDARRCKTNASNACEQTHDGDKRAAKL